MTCHSDDEYETRCWYLRPWLLRHGSLLADRTSFAKASPHPSNSSHRLSVVHGSVEDPVVRPHGNPRKLLVVLTQFSGFGFKNLLPAASDDDSIVVVRDTGENLLGLGKVGSN